MLMNHKAALTIAFKSRMSSATINTFAQMSMVATVLPVLQTGPCRGTYSLQTGATGKAPPVRPALFIPLGAILPYNCSHPN